MVDLRQLHETDFNLWTEAIKTAIAERDFSHMDWDNLIEEIEDMGASQKRALRSYTQRLIEHIFKIQYWKSERHRNLNGWKSEIINFRTEIQNILEDSPSLNNYLANNYLSWYQKSLQKYRKDNLFLVPKHAPIELEKMLANEYFGE
ncbi:MAG: DUF29 domain-containing protein [Cyanobacteria bacterium J06631_2]